MKKKSLPVDLEIKNETKKKLIITQLQIDLKLQNTCADEIRDLANKCGIWWDFFFQIKNDKLKWSKSEINYF